MFLSLLKRLFILGVMAPGYLSAQQGADGVLAVKMAEMLVNYGCSDFFTLRTRTSETLTRWAISEIV